MRLYRTTCDFLQCAVVVVGWLWMDQIIGLPMRRAASMTIGNLRVLAERLFRIRAGHQALRLRLPGEIQPRSLGKDDTQPLSFFEVEVRDACALIIPCPCVFVGGNQICCDATAGFRPGNRVKISIRAVLCIRMVQRSSSPRRTLALACRRRRQRSRRRPRCTRGVWTSS